MERTQVSERDRPGYEFQHHDELRETLGKLLKAACLKACPTASESHGGERYCLLHIQERAPKSLKLQVLIGERAKSVPTLKVVLRIDV